MQKPQILLPALVFSFLGAAGQPKGEETNSPEGNALIQALSVGDTLPQLQLHNVYGVPNNKLALQGTRGKLLILDFFHTTCGSCIVKISKLDSFKNAFPGKLDIVMVTHEPLSYLEKWWPKNRYSRDFSLPVVAQDTVLRSLFPHEIVSHYAWIDENGVVRGITGAEELVYENVKKAIDGQWPNMAVKRDYFEFNPSTPMLLAAYQADMQRGGIPLAYSAFFEPIDGASSVWYKLPDSASQRFRTRIINFSLAKMVTVSNDLRFWLQPSFMVFSDELLKTKPDFIKDFWEKEYCYEAEMPLNGFKEKLHPLLLEDIRRHFDIHAQTETKPTACLQLVLVTPQKLPAPNLPLANPLTDSIHFQKLRTVTNLLNFLNKIPGEPPVVYDGAKDQKIDLWFPIEALKSRTEAAKVLATMGFDLKPDQRMLNILSISKSPSR